MTNTNDTPAHLTQITSDRGLNYLPEIAGHHGGRPDGTLSVHTSSAASGPYVWITSKDRDGTEAARHVSVANALRFADQIIESARSHYQAQDVPGVDNRVTIIHAEIASILRLLEAAQP